MKIVLAYSGGLDTVLLPVHIEPRGISARRLRNRRVEDFVWLKMDFGFGFFVGRQF